MPEEQDDDRISSFIDEGGISADQKYIIDALNAVKDKIQEVDKIKLTLFGSNTISQVVNALKELNQQQQQLDATEAKSIQLNIARIKQRREELKLANDELLAEQKLEQQYAKTAAMKARAAKATKPTRKATGTDIDDSEDIGAFEQLRMQAKLAKAEHDDLFVQMQQGHAVNKKDLDNARKKWKELEDQIKLVKTANKDALNADAAVGKSNRISFLSKEIKNVNGDLAATQLRMEQLGRTQIGRNSAEFKKLAAEADIYRGRIVILTNELKKLDKATADRIALESQRGKSAAAVDKEIADAEKLNSAWLALNETVKQLQARAQELAAKGILGTITEKEKQELSELNIELQNLTSAIAKAEVQMGKGARNTYSYAAQLFSLQQILRETPNIAFGWNIFLASLSNNIPILADDIQRLNQRNKELAASGRPTVSVMGQLWKALTSLTGIIAILTAVITIFLPKIIKVFNEFIRGEIATKKAYLASKEFAQVQKELADNTEKLGRSYRRLAELRSKGMDDHLRKLKGELSAMEALGVEQAKIIKQRQQINKIELFQSDLDLTGGAESIEKQIINTASNDLRTSNTQLTILNNEKAELANRIKEKEKSPLPGTDVNNVASVEKKRLKEIEIEEKLLAQKVELDNQGKKNAQNYADQKLKIEEEYQAGRLSIVERDEQYLIAREKFYAESRAYAKSKEKQAEEEFQNRGNQLATEAQRIEIKNEDPADDKAFQAAKIRRDAAEKDVKVANGMLTQIETDLEEHAQKLIEQENLKQEAIALASEQARRKRLSNITAATEIEIAENDKILASDRTTAKAKLESLDKIRDAQKRQAIAERDFVTSDIGASAADIVEANNELRTALVQIDIETAEERQAILDEYLERRLDATMDSYKAEAAIIQRTNDDILNAELTTLAQRNEALARTLKLRKEGIDLEFNNALLNAGFSQPEADAFKETGKAEISNKKLTLEELLALRKTYESEVSLLIMDASEQNIQNLVAELQRIRTILGEESAKIEVNLESNSLGIAAAAVEEIELVKKAFRDGGLSTKETAEQIFNITRNATNRRLDLVGEALDKELLLYKDSGQRKIETEQRYEAAKKALSLVDKDDEASLKAALEEVEKSKAEYEAALEFYRKYLELIDAIQANKDDKIQLVDQDNLDLLEKENALWEMRFETIRNLEDYAQTVVEGNFSRRMEMLDEEMKKLDERTAKERGMIEQSTLSEEERQKRLAEIELKATNQKEVIEAKRRQEERNRAIREKAMSALRVLVDTAATIQNIRNQANIHASKGDKAAETLARAQVPFVIANGAIALAAIAAVPLPKLKHGTMDFKGGHAIVGDGGKSELVIEPDGSMYVTDDKPEVRYLPKHTVVLPDAEKAMAVADAGFKEQANEIINQSTFIQNNEDLMKLDKTLRSEFAGLNKTIKNKPEVILRRGMNKDLLLRYGADYWKYIN